MSRYDADHGAQLIIYQTSDSTFQGSWALAQHASLSALRAAETGRPVVQAALTGDSAAFDARGRLLAWKGAADRGAVLVTLALPAGLGPDACSTGWATTCRWTAIGDRRAGRGIRPGTGEWAGDSTRNGSSASPGPHTLQGSRAPEGHAPAPAASGRARRSRSPAGPAVSAIEAPREYPASDNRTGPPQRAAQTAGRDHVCAVAGAAGRGLLRRHRQHGQRRRQPFRRLEGQQVRGPSRLSRSRRRTAARTSQPGQGITVTAATASSAHVSVTARPGTR